MQKVLIEMIQSGLVESAHDCSEGGLAVSLVESTYEKGTGLRASLDSELPAEFVLFGEDASRVVLSCDASNLPRIKQVAVQYGLSADVIGETVPEEVEIKINGQVVVSAGVSELRDVYEKALEQALRTEAEPAMAS